MKFGFRFETSPLGTYKMNKRLSKAEIERKARMQKRALIKDWDEMK
jgi:hypothetical protein